MLGVFSVFCKKFGGYFQTLYLCTMNQYILADNQPLTAIALENILRNDGEIKIHRASGRKELVKLLQEHEDSVVILDYTLFDFIDVESLLVVSERFSMVSWILISDDLTEKFIRKIVYSSHAFSIVFKDSPMRDVREAIAFASEGHRFLCQRATEIILSSQIVEDQPAVLTSTEVEILNSIAHGKTTKEIATERFSSVHTINTHRKNIFRKLGVNTAYEAVRFGVRAGLVNPSEFYI